MTDTIRLAGLSVLACHGVLDFEKRIPQPFLLDIAVEADLAPAGLTDDLARSLSYADVAQRAIAVCTAAPVDLIETLAERVAEACLQWDVVEAVDVTVHKPHAPAGVAFSPTTGPTAGASVSVRRERRRAVVIALGTNLGRRVATMRSALDALRDLGGLDVVHVSPLVETDPVGGVAQPDYLNAVVVGQTRLTGERLLRELHRIEAEHGRTRDVRWGARTLDLDLIALGTAGADDEVQVGEPADPSASTPPLTLPHPRAHERAFVVVPWVQATPWMSVRTPGGVVPLGRLLATIDAAGVRRGPSWRADDEWTDLDQIAGDCS